MRDINLRATEYFEAVARLGSVTRAAQDLGVSPSAVSQQLKSLETQLGVRLFRREKRRLILTLDGDRLFQTATQAFSAIRNARSAIADTRNTRALAVRVSPSFGVRWLGPRIAGFISDHPDWTLRINASPDFAAFETEAVDLDLRYGQGDWPGLHQTLLMHDLVLPLCSPDYLTHLQALSEDPVTQIRKARLIDSVKALYRWDFWLACQRIDIQTLTYPFRFDRSSMSIEMAKDGGGLALESVALCLPELERGALVPLSPRFAVLEGPAYWCVCPPRHLHRRAVKRFITWVHERADAHEARARQVLAQHGCQFQNPPGPRQVQDRA